MIGRLRFIKKSYPIIIGKEDKAAKFIAIEEAKYPNPKKGIPIKKR
jgi:hypothetical protein